MATTPTKPPPPSSTLQGFLPAWGPKSKLNHHLHHHRFRRPVDLPLPPPPPPSPFPRSDHSTRSDGDTRPQRAGEGEGNEADHGGIEVEVADEPAAGRKQWNLRPRKAAATTTTEAAVMEVVVVSKEVEVEEKEVVKSRMRSRGLVEEGGEGVMERNSMKRRFWISLSRDEIEEDVYAITGSKPARRPKKRARNVQKYLDNLFPGLWLAGVSAEYYRAMESRCSG